MTHAFIIHSPEALERLCDIIIDRALLHLANVWRKRRYMSEDGWCSWDMGGVKIYFEGGIVHKNIYVMRVSKHGVMDVTVGEYTGSGVYNKALKWCRENLQRTEE